MDEYGFLFSGLDGLSVVAGDFSNYSLLNAFSVSVSSGRRTINLGVTVSKPIILVRHKGFGVGFLNYNGNPTTSVDVYVQGSGVLEVRVFTPDQIKGLTGYGLWIGDSNGNEVYHSDLKYLNVTGRVGVNGGAGQFYVLGTRRQLRFDYRKESSSSSYSYPHYGWVSSTDSVYTCEPRTRRVMVWYSAWELGENYGRYVWEDEVYTYCYMKQVPRQDWVVIGHTTSWSAAYEIYLKKRVLVVYQSWGGGFSEGLVQLSDERIFRVTDGGHIYSNISYGNNPSSWNVGWTNSFAFATSIADQHTAILRQSGFVGDQFAINPPPSAVSSLGTQLIVSDMNYA